MRKGLVQVYTGDGKGKTTAAAGLAARALARGLKVCFFQFVKPGKVSGEIISLQKAGGRNFRHESPGGYHPMLRPRLRETSKKAVLKGWARVKTLVKSGKYDVVVLDEINNVVKLGWVDLDEVLGLIREKPVSVELVLTGRDAEPEVMNCADLVTNFHCVKHPYDKGVKARKGVEY